jgi:hypothetical protein
MRPLLCISFFVILVYSCLNPGSALAQPDSLFAAGFHAPGVQGTPSAVAFHNDTLTRTSRVYVAGATVVTDNGPASGVLMYNLRDETWHDLGAIGNSTIINEIHVLEFHNGRLYAGGDFQNLADDPELDNLAWYDTANSFWRSVETYEDQIDGPVFDIAFMRDSIFIAGQFDSVRGQEAVGVAWFDGNGWHGPARQLDNTISFSDVIVQAVLPDDIDDHRFFYVGGNFNRAGDSVFQNFAIYDLENDQWRATAEGGLNSTVYDIEFDRGYSSRSIIAVGGRFTQSIEGSSFSRVARVSLTYTEATDSVHTSIYQLDTGVGGDVFDIEVGTGIFVAGSFLSAGGDSNIQGIAYWDIYDEIWESVNFNALGARVNDIVLIDEYADEFFAVGEFKQVNGRIVNGLTYRNSDSLYESYGHGLSGNALAMDNDTSGNIYVGGSFTSAGQYFSQNFAVWTDSGWIAFPDGPNQPVQAVAVRNDTVFIGGNFSSVGGKDITRIAYWDGTDWFQLGDSIFNSFIYDLEVGPDDALYAAGSFTRPGSLLVKWDGNDWVDLNPNIENTGFSDADVQAIDWKPNGVMVIMGDFNIIPDYWQGGINARAPGMAYGGGSSWHPLIDSTDFPYFNVSSSEHHDFAVDALGRVFLSTGSEMWINDGLWHKTGGSSGDLCPRMLTVEADGCNVYAGGQWSSPFADCIGNDAVMKFGGFAWSDVAMAYGLNSGGLDSASLPEVYALHEANGKLYIGGKFQLLGEQPSVGFGIYENLPEGIAGGGSIEIVSPSVGDTLKWGDIAFLEFNVTDINELSVQYSLDSGTTWTTLIKGHDATRKLPWIVPDTNAEFCRVRAANADLACDFEESGIFTITSDPDLEVYRLTRYRGIYYEEPFLVKWHNFSFPNDSQSVWPEEHWQSIDYSQWPVPVSTTKEKNKSANPDWGLWVAAYGEDKCYTRNKPPKIVNPTQYFKWKRTRRNPWNGSCYGFTQASLLVFRGLSLNEPNHFWEPDYLYDESLNWFWRKIVNKFWIYASAKKHRIQRRQYMRNLTTNQVLDSVIQSMSPTMYPRGLSFYRETLKEKKKKGTKTGMEAVLVPEDSIESLAGHSVVPYMARNWPDSTGIWYLYVYDNNSPNNSNLFFRFDRNNNTYSYAQYSWSATDTSEGITPNYPVDEFLGYAADPVNQSAYMTSASQPIENDIEIMQSSREQLLLEDTDGNLLGQFEDSLYNDMPDGMPLVPSNPDWPFPHPWGYLVSTGSYKMTISDFDSVTTEITYISDSLTFGYSRTDADSSQTDIIDIGDGFTVSSPDTGAKIMEMVSIAGDDVDGYYYTQINGLSMVQDDSLKIYQDGDTSVVMENNGSAKTYRVLLWRAASTINDYTQSQVEIELGANTTQKLLPAWNGLTDAPMTIQVDEDQDGTYDHEIMADIVLDVDDTQEEASLPGSYQLSQNYPNPFNPVTTIEYALPKRGRVIVEIFNVLGQRVKTLVDRVESAGSHTVTWDGTNASGRSVSTGVYFYRLQVADYTRTKKMLLLK